MAKNDVEFNIGVDTKDAESGIDRLFSGMKTLAVAAAGAFAIKEVFSYVGNGVSEAIAADKAMRQLNIALASTGEYSRAASESVSTMLDELADSAGVSGEAAQQAYALAKSFNLTNEEAEKVTKTAMDLAAATGKDLDSAVKQLAGTYNGVVGPLGKTDKAIKGLSKTQLENGQAVDIITKKYQGAAAAAADTFGGNLNRLRDKLGDVGKEIGFAIIQNPIFQEMMRAAANAVSNFSEWIKKNRDVIVEWTNKILAVSAIIAASFLEVINWLTDKINIFYSTLGKITGVIGQVIPGVELLSKYFNFQAESANKANEVTGEWIKSLDEFSVSALSASKAVDESGKGIKNQEKQARDAAGAIDDLKGSFKELQRELETIEKENAKILQSKEQIAEAENKAAAALAGRAEKELKLTGENTAANLKLIETYKKAAAEKARLAALPLGSFEKLKDDLEKINDELQKQKGLTTDIADAEYERSRESIKNTIIELDGLGKLNEDTLKLVTAYGLAAQKKRELANIDIVKGAVENPFTYGLKDAFLDASKASVDFFAKNLDLAAGISAAGSIANSMLKGKQGAVDAISAASGQIADAFLPGIGPVVSELTKQLSAGPEQTKAMIEEFTKAIPDVIEAIITALPALMEGIATAFPEIIERLAERADVIAVALVRGIAKAIPKILQSGLEIAIGAPLIKGLSKSLNNLFSTAFKAPMEFVPEKITQAFDGLSSKIREIVPQVGKALLGAIGIAMIGVREVLRRILTQMFGAEATKRISMAFNHVAEKIGQIFTQVFNDLSTIAKGIFSGLSDAAKMLIKPFLQLGTILGNVFKSVFRNIGDGLSRLFKDVFNGVFQPALDVLKSVFNRLADFFQGEVLKKIGRLFIEAFDQAIKGVANTASRVFGDVWKIITSAFAGISDFFQNLMAPFQDMIKGAQQFVDDILAAPREFIIRISSAGDVFFNAVTEAGNNLINGLAEFLSQLDPTGGDGKIGGSWGDAWEQAKSVVKNTVMPGINTDKNKKGPITGIKGSPLAKGGDVPPGFPNDTFPARLTSGEAVITDFTTRRLNSFLDKQESKETDTAALVAIMQAMLNELKAGRSMNATITLDGRTLQKSILTLNRQNQRLTV